MTAPTFMPVAPLAAAVAKVVDWATQLDLPEPQEIVLHHRALATGGHVTFTVIDTDDVWLWHQAMDDSVFDIPAEWGVGAYAIGSVFDLPLIVRTVVAS